MKTHHLKTWPEPYEAMRKGYKTFEYRLNDRGFKVGDKIISEEYDPITEKYSGRKLHLNITFCHYSPDFDLPKDHVIMSTVIVQICE